MRPLGQTLFTNSPTVPPTAPHQALPVGLPNPAEVLDLSAACASVMADGFRGILVAQKTLKRFRTLGQIHVGNAQLSRTPLAILRLRLPPQRHSSSSFGASELSCPFLGGGVNVHPDGVTGGCPNQTEC